RDLLTGGGVLKAEHKDGEEGEEEGGKWEMMKKKGKEAVMGRVQKGGRKPEEEEKEIWCSYCQDYHLVAMFTPGMVRAWRHERMCKGAEGKMWVCPHKAFTHQSVRDFTCSVGTECTDDDHEVYVNLDGVRVMRPVMFVLGGARDGGGKVKYKDVKAAMKIRRVRICPHFRMSESIVYGAVVGKEGKPFFQVGRFRQAWGKVEEKLLEAGMDTRERKSYEMSKSRLRVMSSKRVCALCGTTWGFHVSADGRVVYIVLFRPFVHSHGVCHPAWYFQVALPDETEGLIAEWKMDRETFRTSPLTHFAEVKGEQAASDPQV
ncbi:MAG: hypothetical protein Q9211_004978, partial [Gyalolechia sp. 1 TL-2023]